jgi:phosphate transport system substrate-binding protein
MRLFTTFLFCVAQVSSVIYAGETTITTTAIIDGSSTVYPITVAIAERYAAQNITATFEVLCSGTTAGLKRLTTGEVMIVGASRPIKSDELAMATKAGIEIIELPIAFDGLSVVMNKHNTFVDYLTVAELKRIWEPDSTIKTWNQVRSTFPMLPIELFGPGKSSGTFDYFTEVIIGKARASRADYTSSEDDNDLVQGVVRHKGGLGYFGMAYLHENEALLKAIPIDAGAGPVFPTTETVASGAYKPLSRPIFVYVNKAALERKEILVFLEYYLATVPSIAPQVGYVSLPEKTNELVRQRLSKRTVGTLYVNAKTETKLDDLLMAQAIMPENKSMPSTLKSSSASATKSEPVIAKATIVTPVVVPVATPKVVDVTPAPATNSTLSPAPHNPAVMTPGKPPTDMKLSNLDLQQVDYLRERSIAFARLTLDDGISLADLKLRLEELNLLTVSLAKPVNKNEFLSADSSVDDQAKFHALMARLQLTSTGRAILSDSAFIRFKESMNAIQDPSIRRDLARTLLNPGSEQLPIFTAALSAANGGKTDIDTILCYARGGFVIH